MAITTALLPEFDNEMRTTRALIERVPDAKAAFKPHTKSMSMGQLAIHLAAMLKWVPAIVGETELDVAGPTAKALHLGWTSSATALEEFDRALATARETLAKASDDALMVPWTLKSGDHTVFTLPRVAVFRTMVVNHIIHHRGQLSVYLRLNDIPLPDIYGPTADSVR